MKFIGIIFKTEMVQAILDNRKTQTRRTNGLEVLNQNPSNWEFIGKSPEHDVAIPVDKGRRNEPWFQWTKVNNNGTSFIAQCPYGQPGDVLWVRENYLKPPTITNKMLRDGADTWPKFDYQADCSETEIDQYKSWGWTLKPSIHMPKAAARIFLEVTNIRVERLQDISEKDAIAEGVGRVKHYWTQTPFYKDYTYYSHQLSEDGGFFNPISSFRSLWYSINGEESWDANPWVWVVEFKQIQKPINFK